MSGNEGKKILFSGAQWVVMVEVRCLSAKEKEQIRYVFFSEITYALINSALVILMAKKIRDIINIHFQICILEAFLFRKWRYERK
jgi:hypothetical protein